MFLIIQRDYWRSKMDNRETNILLDDYFETSTNTKELYRISNQIKSSLAIKSLKNNLRNFIASTNIA